jgi:hypothetical protein
MWLRPDAADPHRPHEHIPTQRRWPVSRTTTPIDPASIPVGDEAFQFLLQLQLHGARSLHRGQAFDPSTRRERDAVIATAHDNSRAEAFTEPESDGTYRVIHSGPRRIFDTIEVTRRLFSDLGRPNPDKFGVVANDSTQFVWCGDDDSWHRWPLPLV